jgi:hypothetical protein
MCSVDHALELAIRKLSFVSSCWFSGWAIDRRAIEPAASRIVAIPCWWRRRHL